MRWRLQIEEYGANLNYIKGQRNIVADALSRLDLQPKTVNESNHHGTLLQLFTGDTIKDVAENKDTVYPLKLKDINKAQQNDTKLMQELRSDNNQYTLNTFCGGGKHLTLLCKNNRICWSKTAFIPNLSML